RRGCAGAAGGALDARRARSGTGCRAPGDVARIRRWAGAMTSDRQRRPYSLRLDAEGCGTLLGALTWVMGALAILEDRGHASGDESFHELSDALTPQLDRLVRELSGTRAAAGNDPQREAAVETA